jgi:hypothetical protein
MARDGMARDGDEETVGFGHGHGTVSGEINELFVAIHGRCVPVPAPIPIPALRSDVQLAGPLYAPVCTVSRGVPARTAAPVLAPGAEGSPEALWLLPPSR